MGVEFVRAPMGADVDEYVSGLLRGACRAAEPFALAPAVYIASNERRAKRVSRLSGEAFPEGTPERVSRELLKLFAPQLRLRGEVERDFDFFGALSAALEKTESPRRPGRPLVNELIKAWKRLSQSLPMDHRTGEKPAWLNKLGERGQLLSDVVKSYTARLRDVGQYDPEDSLWLAAEQITDAGVAPNLLIVEELDRVTPARRALIESLADAAKRTLFILRDTAALPFLDPANKALQDLAYGDATPDTPFPNRPGRDVAEAWLAENALPKQDHATLMRPLNRTAEVRQVAREIKRAASKGESIGDICVAFPSSHAYRELIEESFTEAGVPFDAPFETPLASIAPVAAIMELIRVARDGLDRIGLIDALASPFLPFGLIEPDRAERLGEFEEATRKAWIVGGRDIEQAWLKKLADAPPSVTEWTGVVLSAIQPFLGGSMRAVAFVEAAATLLEESGAGPVVDDDLSKPEIPGGGVRAAGMHEFRNLLNQMRAEFTRIGNPSLKMSELFRALREQTESRSVRAPEASGERVRVMGLRELRGLKFRRVFVLGLTDQDLPLPDDTSMFFPATREDVIASALGPELARELVNPIDAPAQADYLYANALMSANESLVLSYPKAEGETPCVPAVPHARLMACLGLGEDSLPSGLGEPVPISTGEVARELARRLNADARGDHVVALSEPALQSGMQGRVVELARSDLASPPSEYEGLVSASAELEKRFAPDAEQPHEFSPSQIDTYVECPMRFWMRYVIRAKAPEEPTLETRPNEIGTLLHAAFEKFAHLLRKEAGQPEVLADPRERESVSLLELAQGVEMAASTLGHKLIRQAFESARKDNPNDGPFWAGLRTLMCAGLHGETETGLGKGVLAQFIEEEIERNRDGISLRFTEFDFGKREPDADHPDAVPEPLDFPVEGGHMRLMGSVDRVDETPDGLDVVDYKTGNDKPHRDIRDGKAFQLPVYLGAISKIVGVQPHGMSYLKLPPEKPRKRNDVAPKVDNKKQTVVTVAELVTELLPKRLRRMMDAMVNGVFIHVPFAGVATACKYCDFKTACARREEVIGERQYRFENAETPETPQVYLPDKEALQ